jgi:DNA-binding response OmpR family regulator
MKKRILLVEDSKELGEAIKIILTQDDKYNVSLTPNLKNALKLLKEESPELIILDILLEDGNGIDFLKDIRTNHNIKTPVIMLTNIDKDKEIYEANNLGVAYYLIKSNVQLEEISEKVNGLLEEQN